MTGEPFGKPFRYIDSYDLPGHFQEPAKVPWFKRWRKKRHPVAWAVTGSAVQAEAYVCPPEEPKASLVHPGGAIVPVYDDAIVLAAAEAMQERGE